MVLYRRTRSTRLLVVSLVMLSLMTITVDFRGGEEGPFAAAGRGALATLAPLQAAVSRVFRPVGDFFTGLVHVGSLKGENDALREEVERLRSENVEGVSIQRENEKLLALIGLRDQLGLEGVPAIVIGESVSNFEWTVTIDRGSSDGVEVDMPVVTGEGLVGHVVRVSGRAATVELIIDPESAVAGRLVGSGETGLVLGDTDLRDLTMDLVDDETEVNPDERVVTSGYQGGLYPPRIVIGSVSHVTGGSGGVSKVVTVRPAVDFSSLDIVLVVTNHRAIPGP
ncbi:MAG: rod shape-determining protein MreC [Actinobacteria bacterium]|nr:rod shape-determining protein MreC [Actinomycetota bacterium]